MSRAWGPPAEWPPGATHPKKPGAVILDDLNRDTRALFPLPYLQDETAPFPRIPPSVCFCLHPLGATEIFVAAVKVFVEGEMPDLDGPELAALRTAIWRGAADAFCPGQSMRDGVERLVQKRSKVLTISTDPVSPEENQVRRIELLALFAVVAGVRMLAEDKK